MRFLFLIPERPLPTLKSKLLHATARTRAASLPGIDRWLVHAGLYTPTTYGGTLNIMRHCAVARSLGAAAALLTRSGKDSYQEFAVADLPNVAWADVQADDVLIIPDFCSNLVDQVPNRAIVYEQVPLHVNANFDYRSPRVKIWTDSPFMVEVCRQRLPGVDVPIVPNVVDPVAFEFRAQSERSQGLIMAFPRKAPEFIDQTESAYAALGGKYWHFERIDGLTLNQLAKRMREPQAYLASAEMEGCALPPQECMAAGIVVVGRSARGANFAMGHRHTAMVAETPQDAAVCLQELEDVTLRDQIARNGHQFISRYFPQGEPSEFWRGVIASYATQARNK